MWYFYVLKILKKYNWFYKGSTNDLKRRFAQHNEQGVQSSKHYAPFKLVYYEAYLDETTARKRENPPHFLEKNKTVGFLNLRSFLKK